MQDLIPYFLNNGAAADGLHNRLSGVFWWAWNSNSGTPPAVTPHLSLSLPQGKPFSPLASLDQCRHEAEEDEEHCSMQGTRSHILPHALQ